MSTALLTAPSDVDQPTAIQPEREIDDFIVITLDELPRYLDRDPSEYWVIDRYQNNGQEFLRFRTFREWVDEDLHVGVAIIVDDPTQFSQVLDAIEQDKAELARLSPTNLWEIYCRSDIYIYRDSGRLP